MAWIRTIGEEEATGVLAKIYKGSQRSWGGVDNIIKAHSLNMAALRARMTFYNGLMHGDCDLPLAQREINQITKFFAWCNRTIDGLGVELEAFWAIEGATNV